MSPKPAPRPAARLPRRGSAALAVLLLVAVAIGLAAYLLIGGGGRATEADAPVVKTEVVPAADIEQRAESALGGRESADAPAVASAERVPRTVTEDPARFKGRGSLAGFVQVTSGEVPATWTLVLKPSTSLLGREHAVPQRIEMTASDFAVEDLPLAGYDVHAEAPGMNARAQPVLLERTSSHAYLVLELVPAGTLTGTVLDADGNPAEGVEVWLHPPSRSAALELPGPDGRRAETRADGTYAFEGVLDGPYVLRIGDRTNPLVGPLQIMFQGPTLTVPARKLPATATLLLLVVDLDNQPVAGAEVTGFGARGGAVDTTTPPNGRLLLEHLAPGRWEFQANHPLFGSARLARQFEGGEDESQVLVLMEAR